MMRRMMCLLLAASALAFTVSSPRAEKLRLAEAGSPDLKNLIDVVAFEHAKQRGVDYELVYLKSDDVATQAIVGKQVDVVVSSLAYAATQALDAPFRHFMQLRLLRFYPIAAASTAHSWKDMDGKDFVVHARGSGTEIAAHEIERQNNIKFAHLTYLPGSQVRANTLLNGLVKATLLDIEALRYVQSKAPDRFVLLPVPDLKVSEAALYASQATLASRRADLEIIVEELLKAFRRSAREPGYIAAERKRLNLLPDLSPGRVAEIESYYREAAKQGVYPLDGGGAAAAKADLEFYAQAGILKGDPASLRVEDFWDLGILADALGHLGPAAQAEP